MMFEGLRGSGCHVYRLRSKMLVCLVLCWFSPSAFSWPFGSSKCNTMVTHEDHQPVVALTELLYFMSPPSRDTTKTKVCVFVTNSPKTTATTTAPSSLMSSPVFPLVFIGCWGLLLCFFLVWSHKISDWHKGPDSRFNQRSFLNRNK